MVILPIIQAIAISNDDLANQNHKNSSPETVTATTVEQVTAVGNNSAKDNSAKVVKLENLEAEANYYQKSTKVAPNMRLVLVFNYDKSTGTLQITDKFEWPKYWEVGYSYQGAWCMNAKNHTIVECTNSAILQKTDLPFCAVHAEFGPLHCMTPEDKFAALNPRKPVPLPGDFGDITSIK